MASIGDVTGKGNFTFIWTIENASILTLSNKILSPTFVIQEMEMTKWHLGIKFVDTGCPGLKGLFLYVYREKDESLDKFEIVYAISLIEGDEFRVSQRYESKFERLGCDVCEAFFEYDEIKDFFPTDSLTVRCRLWKLGCDLLQSDLCFARTHLSEETNTFVWAIKRFSSLRPGQHVTRYIHPTIDTLPTLILTFYLQEKNGKEYVYIKVRRSPTTGARLMDLEVSILDTDGEYDMGTYSNVTVWTAHEGELIHEFREIFEKSAIMSQKDRLLSNDVLSLRFQFECDAGLLWSKIESYTLLETSDEEESTSETQDVSYANACCPFKKILQTLYEDGTLSDISLKAGSQTFSVHKSILSARSPVFEVMFTKDMREKTANCVDITDLDAETLRRLLVYIYTNRIEKLQWEAASDLFRAADKYEILDLREKCSNLLKGKISPSNACEILVLADMHHDQDLKRVVQDFIVDYSDIFDSQAWEKLKEEHSKLAFETTEQIIRKMWNSRS